MKKWYMPLVYILCEALFVFVGSLIIEILMRYQGFNMLITSNNKDSYIQMFAVLCSVVFISTSLMSMLSERNIFIYWVDIVQKVLIEPVRFNFIAMVIYSFVSAVASGIGLYLRNGSLVISSLVFGLADVSILFFRMSSVFYMESYYKKKIKKDLLKAILAEQQSSYDYVPEYKEQIFLLEEMMYMNYAMGRDYHKLEENLDLFMECYLDERLNDSQKEFFREAYVNNICYLLKDFPHVIEMYLFGRKQHNDNLKKINESFLPNIASAYISMQEKGRLIHLYKYWFDNNKKSFLEYSKDINSPYRYAQELDYLIEFLSEYYCANKFKIISDEDILFLHELMKEFHLFVYKEESDYHKKLYTEVFLKYSFQENINMCILNYLSKTSNDDNRDKLVKIALYIHEFEEFTFKYFSFTLILKKLLEKDYTAFKKATKEKKRELVKKSTLMKIVNSICVEFQDDACVPLLAEFTALFDLSNGNFYDGGNPEVETIRDFYVYELMTAFIWAASPENISIRFFIQNKKATLDYLNNEIKHFRIEEMEEAIGL